MAGTAIVFLALSFVVVVIELWFGVRMWRKYHESSESFFGAAAAHLTFGAFYVLSWFVLVVNTANGRPLGDSFSLFLFAVFAVILSVKGFSAWLMDRTWSGKNGDSVRYLPRVAAALFGVLIVGFLYFSINHQDRYAPYYYDNAVDGERYRAPICAGDESADFRLTGSVNEPITVAEVSVAILRSTGQQVATIELDGGNDRHSILESSAGGTVGDFDFFVTVPLPELAAGEYVYSHTATDINRVDEPSVATNVLQIPFEVAECD